MRRAAEIQNDESGMALVVVLAVVSVLLAAALNLARTAGHRALAIGAETDLFLAKERALSGVHLAMAFLAEDAATSEGDSLQEDWARPERLKELVAVSGYKPDTLFLEIRDELGKLQINGLLKTFPGHEADSYQIRLWEAFFTSFSHEAVGIVGCLKDWLDSRDDEAITGLSGAESDYYLSLDVPYTCANAPFTHISEIFLVRGITRALFGEMTPESLITVHGLDTTGSGQGRARYPGRVNINTAPEEVLRALLDAAGEMGDRAGELVDYREAREEDTFTHALDAGWITQVVALTTKEKGIFDQMIRYNSDLFRVNSRAVEHQAKAGISALVLREKDEISGLWSCKIMALEREE